MLVKKISATLYNTLVKQKIDACYTKVCFGYTKEYVLIKQKICQLKQYTVYIC